MPADSNLKIQTNDGQTSKFLPDFQMRLMPGADFDKFRSTGMAGRAKRFPDRGVLNDRSPVQHDNSGTYVRYRRQIVGDKDQGKIFVLLEFMQQFKYLYLGNNIQGAHGLISDKNLRIGNQCARYGDALTLASGKFMGQPVCYIPVQPHAFQGGGNLQAPFRLVRREAQRAQGFPDNFFNLLGRIQ
jgi:hypothetical protein